jgi:transcription elongation GreA/GreB family factor
MSQILVTKNGLAALEVRRVQLMDELKAIQGQKGEAAEVGGNVWHDNFAFEELVRQENILNKQIRDVSGLLKIAIVVPDIPTDTHTLQVGHLARLYIEEEDRVQEVVVGGFGETDLKSIPPIIDYNAPLLEAFQGHEQGHEAVVQLGGVSKTVILESIQPRRR